MNFFRKIKAIFSNNFDEMIKQYMAGEDVKIPIQSALNQSSAMKYSAFFACLRVLAETFASVSVFEYKTLPGGDREKTDDTGLYDILHNVPNEEMSAYNYHESSMYQMNLGGNAISERILNSAGGVVGLYPLDYSNLTIDRDKQTKRLLYKYRVDNREVTYSRDQVFHVPGPSINGINGMSILEYAANAVRLGMTYETFGQKFFQNGALPSGIFVHPGHLSDEGFDRLKKHLNDNWTGLSNAGKPIITEDNMQFQPIPLKLVDAELLSSKKLQTEDVCRFCRVPLHLIQNLDKATNNNIEHQSLEFVMYTMLPHFKRFEQAYNTQLLSQKQREQGYYFEFNLASLLRGDQKSMAEAFALGRINGWLSVNDIRRMMNMNRIENGDIYLQPMNMIEAGKEPDMDDNNQIRPDSDAIENILRILESRK